MIHARKFGRGGLRIAARMLLCKVAPGARRSSRLENITSEQLPAPVTEIHRRFPAVAESEASATELPFGAKPYL